MIKRSEKLAFMEVTEGEGTVYKRMTGFTEFSLSKNPKEYSRKYIDEDMERSEVVGYSPAISYKFVCTNSYARLLIASFWGQKQNAILLWRTCLNLMKTEVQKLL